MEGKEKASSPVMGRSSEGWRRKHQQQHQQQGLNEHCQKQSNGDSGCRSNIDCFLQYTTPSVPSLYLPKTRGSEGCLPFFHLREVWDAFDEWSVYGAGVPVSLPGQGGQTPVQYYYVPYLSALQIYEPANYPAPSCSHRRLGDESEYSSDADDNDGSEKSPGRKVSEGVGGSNWNPAPPPRSEGSSSMSEVGSTDGYPTGAANLRRHILFEYFERASPYGRAPLSDKVAELACTFPKLKTLRSFELSPASWFSVAWYPIYRIPTGPTLRDLAACFLTFHSLSVPFQEDTRRRMEGGVCMGNEMQISDGNDLASQSHLVDQLKINLPAFGLASYKLRGALWAMNGKAEKRRMSVLATSADEWLKRLDVDHPDFNFFASHGAFCKF